MNKKLTRGIVALLVIVIFTAIGVFIGTKIDNDPPVVVIETPPISTPDPTEEPSQTPEPIVDPVYGFKQQEIFLMAQLLCGDKNRDGDGEYDIDFGNDDRYDQISLVLCVVMNRVNDDRFPNTVEDVIWQNNGTTYQFSVMKQWDDSNKVCQPSDIAIQRVTEWCEAYDRGDPGAQSIPMDHVKFKGNGKENISSTMN